MRSLTDFAGLPPAGAIDGPLAAAWQADIYSPRYYNNCTSSLDQFQATIAKTGFAEKARVYPGWFDDTFPLVKPFPIALLRIDVDWYKPTFACLLKFWSMLVPDALVLLDDYYVCARLAGRRSMCSWRSTRPRCRCATTMAGSLAYLIKPSTPYA